MLGNHSRRLVVPFPRFHRVLDGQSIIETAMLDQPADEKKTILSSALFTEGSPLISELESDQIFGLPG